MNTVSDAGSIPATSTILFENPHLVRVFSIDSKFDASGLENFIECTLKPDGNRFEHGDSDMRISNTKAALKKGTSYF